MTLQRFTFTLVTLAASAVLHAGARSTTLPVETDANRTASRLLQTLADHAVHVRDNIGSVVEMSAVPSFHWQTYAIRLNLAATDINAMGRTLAQLELLRDKVQPWQRVAIDEATPLARLMAKSASDAISALGDNKVIPWRSPLPSALQSLYKESDQMRTVIHKLEKYAKVHSEDRQLENELNLASGS